MFSSSVKPCVVAIAFKPDIASSNDGNDKDGEKTAKAVASPFMSASVAAVTAQRSRQGYVIDEESAESDEPDGKRFALMAEKLRRPMSCLLSKSTLPQGRVSSSISVDDECIACKYRLHQL